MTDKTNSEAPKKHGFLSRYETDEVLAETGQWVDFGDGVMVKLRSANSIIAQEIIDELYQPYTAMRRANRMPPDLDQRLMMEWAAKGLIVEWSGMPHPKDKAQKDIADTLENKMLVCSELPSFTLDVINIARANQTFAPHEQEDAAKNSSPRSSGKATTESA